MTKGKYMKTAGQRQLLLFLLALGVSMLLVSCAGDPEESASPPQETDVDIKEKNGVITITDKGMGGQLVFGASSGARMDVPETFPEDLPLFPDLELNNHLIHRGAVFSTFFSEKPMSEIKKYFVEGPALKENGWEITTTKETGRGFEIDIQKNGRRAIINLTSSRSPDGTQVTYFTLAK